MHCSAFCHPFPGIMSGITNRSKASSHFPPPSSPPQLLEWGVEREVWCCISLVLWELIPRPKAFGDISPPIVIACPSCGAAISASTSQEAASNAPQSKTTLVLESQFHPCFHVSFAYICIAHRFMGGEEALERHILYSSCFLFSSLLSAELYLFI